MFCTKCGNPIGAEDNVCTRCGAPVENKVATSASTSRTASSGEKLSFNFSNLKKESFSKYDIVMCIAALVAIIAVFLPALTLKGERGDVFDSYSLFEGGTIFSEDGIAAFPAIGIVVILASILIAGLCMSNVICNKNFSKYAWIPAIANVVVIIVFFTTVSSFPEKIADSSKELRQIKELLNNGIGIYAVIAATAVNLILPFTSYAGEKKFDMQKGFKGNLD